MWTILPLQKKIDPAQVIVTANGQTISGIDELLDFGGYYRIVRNGKKDLSFRRSEVQFQQNCLADGKNQEAFQYFKETAAAISLVAENDINILSMQYDKIQQVSEDTVLASYLAPQKEVKAPQMPEAVIYPFGLNQSQKLAVERALSSKISIIQGPPGTGKTQTILNIIANVVRSGKTVAVVSNNNSATHNVAEKLEKKNAAFSDCVSREPCQQAKVLGGTDRRLSEYERLGNAAGGTAAIRSGDDCAFQRTE